MTSTRSRGPVAAHANGRNTATRPATLFHQPGTGSRRNVARNGDGTWTPNRPPNGYSEVTPISRYFATGHHTAITSWDRRRHHATAFGGLLTAAVALTWPLPPTAIQLGAATFGAATAAATLWPAIPTRAVTGVPRPLQWAATVAALSATAMTTVLTALLTNEAIT